MSDIEYIIVMNIIYYSMKHIYRSYIIDIIHICVINIYCITSIRTYDNQVIYNIILDMYSNYTSIYIITQLFIITTMIIKYIKYNIISSCVNKIMYSILYKLN